MTRFLVFLIPLISLFVIMDHMKDTSSVTEG